MPRICRDYIITKWMSWMQCYWVVSLFWLDPYEMYILPQNSQSFPIEGLPWNEISLSSMDGPANTFRQLYMQWSWHIFCPGIILLHADPLLCSVICYTQRTTNILTSKAHHQNLKVDTWLDNQEMGSTQSHFKDR